MGCYKGRETMSFEPLVEDSNTELEYLIVKLEEEVARLKEELAIAWAKYQMECNKSIPF